MAKSVSKAANEKYRAEFMEKLRKFLVDELGEDVQQTASNELCFPFVNELQEDQWIRLSVQIPTGSRAGDPFDGYEQAQDYTKKSAESAERAAKAASKKADKIARDTKAREIAAKGKASE